MSEYGGLGDELQELILRQIEVHYHLKDRGQVLAAQLLAHFGLQRTKLTEIVHQRLLQLL